MTKTLPQLFLDELDENPDITLAEFHEKHGYPDIDSEDFGLQVMRLMRWRYEG